MLDTAWGAGQTGPLLANRYPAMASRRLGTIISNNPIPLTALFTFFVGSPAKPENTTIRAPIPKKTAPSTPINPYSFSHACGLLTIVRGACPLFRARHD